MGDQKVYARLALLSCIMLSWAALADAPPTGRADLTQRNVQFNQLTAEHGLSQEMVYDIAQDGRGFIWIATQEGLNRYNGHQVEVFEHLRTDPNTLSHDFIRSLMVDQDGVLWIGTEAGVNRYNAREQRFERQPFANVGLTDLPSDSIRAMLQTKDGTFWFGTASSGLLHVDPRVGLLRQFRNNPETDEGLPDDTVLSLLEDSKGNLWVGTRTSGLFRFDPVRNRFVAYGQSANPDVINLGREVRRIYEDRSGFLWIATADSGLTRFDLRRNAFERFSLAHEVSGSVGDNRVRDVIEDARGTIWIATNHGIAEWRSANQTFTHYTHDNGDPRSLAGNRVNRLFVDASGVLWVGTWDGVSRWNYFSDTFSYYGAENGLLSGNVVTSVGETSDATLWVGTYGTGLSQLNLLTGEMRTYQNDPNDPTSLPDNRVMAVHVDNQDQVWVGTRSAGLARLDNNSGRFVRYTHDPKQSDSLSGNAITSIYTDAQGSLWVGTYGAGLNRLLADANTFEHYRHDPQVPTSLSGDQVLTLFADSDGVLWIGTDGEGLNRFDPATASFVRFAEFSIDASANPGANAFARANGKLALETVTDLLQDNNGALWIGTLGQGLLRWDNPDADPTSARVKVYSKAEGLPTDTIYAILQGQNGSLWLSSNRGLTVLKTSTGAIRQFDNRNGLRENEFNQGARLHSRSGRLLFGGTAGLLGFYPGELPVNNRAPDIVLGARSRETQLASVASGEAAPYLELDYLDRYIAFDFVALDYMSPDKNQYRYMLEGFDNDWIEDDGFHRAAYTNLPPGQFTFRVKAANNDGVWNQDGAAIEVRVISAPWNSWWAYLGYAFIVMTIIGLTVRSQRLRLQREARQRVLLEQEVDERTRELAARNSDLERLNDKLAEASVTDSLTGLRNRRYVDQFINSEVSLFERSQREEGHVAPDDGGREHTKTMFFMMIDLDGFKLINDEYGHHAGDLALIQVTDMLKRCTRNSDTVVRWGGDEFMVIGFASGFFGVKILAERIRESIAEHRYDVGNGNFSELSASIGFAPYPLVEARQDFSGWEVVAGVADQAAYIAKANGRNAWVSISGTENLEPDLTTKLPTNLTELVHAGHLRVDSSVDGNVMLPGEDEAPQRAVAG